MSGMRIGPVGDVWFSPPGSAVQRRVESKLGESISVKDYGAVGSGSVNDAPAFQAAIDFAVSSAQSSVHCPVVTIPDGNYRLDSPITVARNVKIVGVGWPTVTVNHTGVGFAFSGVPAVNVFPRNVMLVEGIRFTVTNGVTATCIIQNGQSTGGLPTYLYSQNDTEISSCSFDQFAATNAVLSYRGFGVNFNSCQFNSLTVDAAVEMKQSNSDDPFWSFGFTFNACDFTAMAGGGRAIRSDSGDVWMYGGIVEGCSGDAIVLGNSAAYSATLIAGFFGVYFEHNTGNHVNVLNKPGTVGFYSCKFVSGGVGSKFNFKSGTSASFYNCMTPNNAPSFTGEGNVNLYGCQYMYGSASALTALRLHDHVIQTTDPVTPNNLNGQLIANGPSGGAGALVMCNHFTAGANGTVSELFLIRHGVAANNFSAVSLSRSTGTNLTTFAWSVDANGMLQVAASAPGTANYQVITHGLGVFFPA